MRRHRGGLIASSLAGLALAGCATDNNTLIFGTSTNIGLDVSAAPNQGGAPQLTLGYKRAEGVWMPLREIPATTTPPSDNPTAMYQSENSGPGSIVRKDAYSVFASIGAKFNGGAQATQAQAGAGLAQFFATGAAAVSVTQNEALVTVLKVSDPQSSQAQAQAVAAATTSDLDTAIGKMPPEARAAIKQSSDAMSQAEFLKLTGLVTCVGTDEAKWKSTVDKANTDHPGLMTARNVENLKKLDSPAKRADWLTDSATIMAALATACTASGAPS